MKHTLNNKAVFRKADRYEDAIGISKSTKYRAKSVPVLLPKIAFIVRERKHHQLPIETNRTDENKKTIFEEPGHTKSARIYELLNQNYDLMNADNIFNFVSKEAKLVGFLVDARKKIASFFPNIRLQLEHTTDPEIHTWEKLWIKIPVQVGSNTNTDELNMSLQKIDELREQWWLDIPFNIRKLVSIELNFDEV